KEESTLEGTSVTLSYKYKNAAIGNEYFFWYRQFPGKPPEFLISHSGTGTPISQTIPGFSFKVSDDQRQMDLQISSAAVTDSAVYYCAVRPTVTGNNKTLYKNLQQPTTSTNTTSTRGFQAERSSISITWTAYFHLCNTNHLRSSLTLTSLLPFRFTVLSPANLTTAGSDCLDFFQDSAA
uniref:Ig-like domain-containing protein n=1 Tax=Oryzias latipes TaxID=8090 RepID=A0A3P9ME56_ORYLA